MGGNAAGFHAGRSRRRTVETGRRRRRHAGERRSDAWRDRHVTHIDSDRVMRSVIRCSPATEFPMARAYTYTVLPAVLVDSSQHPGNHRQVQDRAPRDRASSAPAHGCCRCGRARIEPPADAPSVRCRQRPVRTADDLRDDRQHPHLTRRRSDHDPQRARRREVQKHDAIGSTTCSPAAGRDRCRGVSLPMPPRGTTTRKSRRSIDIDQHDRAPRTRRSSGSARRSTSRAGRDTPLRSIPRIAAEVVARCRCHPGQRDRLIVRAGVDGNRLGLSRREARIAVPGVDQMIKRSTKASQHALRRLLGSGCGAVVNGELRRRCRHLYSASPGRSQQQQLQPLRRDAR